MLGIGTDILRTSRIKEVLKRRGGRFASRILAARELAAYDQHPAKVRFLAKRFAAKEAVGKALGTGIGQGVSWHDIEVAHNDIGAPVVVLRNAALARAKFLGGTQVLISISDEHEYVVAFAALVKGSRPENEE